MSPEPRIQVAPRADFLGVERDDEVAFPNARPLAGPAGDHSRHHDALLERVREYAEPRAPRAAHHAPVAYELVLVHLIRVDGDRQRAPRDLVEIQIQDPEEPPAHIEQPAAAVPGIRGARHDPAVEEVLPVRLELAEVGHVAATRAPLLGSCRAHGNDRRPSLESFGRCERRRPEPLSLHPHERQARLEVLRHHFGFLAAALHEGHLHGLRTHDDVVDGEDQARFVDDDAAAHPLVAEDGGGRMVARDRRVQVHDGLEEVLDERDGRVHRYLARR